MDESGSHEVERILKKRTKQQQFEEDVASKKRQPKTTTASAKRGNGGSQTKRVLANSVDLNGTKSNGMKTEFLNDCVPFSRLISYF